MDKYSKGVLLGITLGDSHIRNNRIEIRHSISQKDYLEYKSRRIFELLGKEKNPNLREISNNGFKAVDFSVSNKVFGLIRKILYKPKKYISKDILRLIPDEGIAFWYMDDGSLYEKKNSKGYELVISTYCDTEEEAIGICEFFKERYDCNFTVKRNKGKFSVRCGKNPLNCF